MQRGGGRWRAHSKTGPAAPHPPARMLPIHHQRVCTADDPHSFTVLEYSPRLPPPTCRDVADDLDALLVNVPDVDRAQGDDADEEGAKGADALEGRPQPVGLLDRGSRAAEAKPLLT